MLSMWCKRASDIIFLKDATTNQPEGPNCFVQVVASLDLSIDLVLVKVMVIHNRTHSLLLVPESLIYSATDNCTNPSVHV